MKKERKKGEGKLSMFNALLLFAMIPMVTLGLIIGIVSFVMSEKGTENLGLNYMKSIAKSEGVGLEDAMKLEKKEKVLTKEYLTDYCDDITLEGLSSSYCYIADKDANMLYHPTSDKIGKPVSNEVIKNVCKDMKNGKRDESEIEEYEYEGVKKIASYYVAKDLSYVFVVTTDKKDIMQNINDMELIIIVVGIISAIVFAIIVALVGRKISRPLKDVADNLSDMSEGDLITEVKTQSHIHETVGLIKICKNMRKALFDSVSTIKNNSEPLKEAVIDVDSKTQKNLNDISQISETINEVAKTSQEVAKNAQDMTERTTIFGEDIDRLSENVKKLKDASLEIDKVNKEASKHMDTVMVSSNESVQAVKDISDKISETNNAVSNIATCVQMIEDISSQTNLLSLNASIEAARAGEAGKGFAVVAEEIRQLADDSANSAQDIRRIVESITRLSTDTVSQATKVGEIIEKEQKFIGETQDKFNILSKSVDISTSEIVSIDEMTSELEKIKEELTKSTSNLGAISQELGASSQEVSASCENVAEACNDTQTKTNELKIVNENLNKAVDFFRV